MLDTVSAYYNSVLHSWRNVGFAKIISWGEHFLFPFFMLVPKERPKQRKIIADVKNYLAMVTEEHWASTDKYTVNGILVLIGVTSIISPVKWETSTASGCCEDS